MREPRWYTPEDVAGILQVKSGDVVNLIRSGRLSGAEVAAGALRVSPVALRRYLVALERPRRKRFGVAVAVALLIGLGVTASTLRAERSASATSAVLPYQGYLEEGGAPAEGPRVVTFGLFSSASSTEALWSETIPVTAVAGKFSANLGTAVPLDAVLNAGTDLYLEVAVAEAEGGAEPVRLEGRQLIGSVAFARRATPGRDFIVDGELRIGDVSMVPSGALRSPGALQVSSDDLQLIATSGAVRIGSDTPTPVHLDVEGSSTVHGALSTGALSVESGATVGGVLNANGRVNLGGTQLTCVFMTTCPSSWVNRGSAGFILHESMSCPFTPGGAFNDWWNWCHPVLCCNQ